STPNWTDGNFDHQPTINLTDLSAVLNNFGTTTPNLSSQSPFTNPQLPPTPEPTSFALFLPLLILPQKRKNRTREHICART
ncbi:MAG: hypothetical protein ACTHN5_09945, partial [Phycisphaerae bacterium]